MRLFCPYKAISNNELSEFYTMKLSVFTIKEWLTKVGNPKLENKIYGNIMLKGKHFCFQLSSEVTEYTADVCLCER